MSQVLFQSFLELGGGWIARSLFYKFAAGWDAEPCQKSKIYKIDNFESYLPPSLPMTGSVVLWCCDDAVSREGLCCG